MFNQKIKKFIKLTLSISAIFIAVILLAYLYIAYFLPIPENFSKLDSVPTTKIYDRNGILLYEILNPETGKKSSLSLEQFPQKFLEATISAEDKDFFNHIGVDFGAIARAFIYNTLEQKVVSGGSTITQQLVRNLLGMNRERGFSDKVLETIYAIRLSHLYSKEKVLEQYLNTVYYGNISYGAQSAALNYFAKNIYDLDLAEMTLLAGLPQSPTRFNPFVSFEKAKKRQKYVLEQMAKNAYIEQSQVDAAYKEPLKLRKNITEIKAPHFVHQVINELEALYGEDKVNYGGLTVITTLDYNLQQTAERTIERNIEKLSEKNVNNGALLAADVKSGQILAWVGSKDYFNDEIQGQVDLITSLRQPGSALKPFLYLLALEKGYTPATVLEDIPLSFETATGPYTPQNYDLTYHGPVRMRIALANSYNIPAVKMLEQLGVSDFIRFLEKLGLKTLTSSPDFYGLSLTLGGGEVTLKDMVSAYSVLADQGKKKDFSTILTIKESPGEKTLYQWKAPSSENVLGNYGVENTYLINNILSDKNARLQSFGEGNVLELTHQAAAKTGTTRNFRDNWTFGYTPSLVTGVWVGNADASPMQNISGIDGAGPIWHDFMEEALRLKRDEYFLPPPTVHQVEICSLSGLLPSKWCQEKILEWFIKGKEPKQTDNTYKLYECPGFTKIFIDYPLEFKKWAEDRGLTAPPNCRVKKDPQENSGNNTEANAQDNNVDVTINLPGQNQQNQKEKHEQAINILSPLPGDSYKIDQTLPLTSQKIPLKFVTTVEAKSFEVYLNNTLIKELGGENTVFFWEPQKGVQHLQIEVKLTDGTSMKSPEVEFEVL